MNNVRNGKLDFIKGVLIYCVILGHTASAILAGGGMQGLDNYLNIIMMGFHMPLFMGVSGWLFYNTVNKHSEKDIIIRRLKGIGVTILVWGIIYSLPDILKCLLNGNTTQAVKEFSSHIFSYWFLWSVLFCNLIHLLLVKTIRNKWKYLAIIVVTFVLMLLPRDNVHAAFMYPFFAIAYELHENRPKKVNYLCITAIAAILWLVMSFEFDRSYTVYETESFMIKGGFDSLYKYTFRFAIGMASGWVVYMICKLVYDKWNDKKVINIVSSFGKCSLELYVTHTIALEVGKRVFGIIYRRVGYDFIIENRWALNFLVAPVIAILLTVALYHLIQWLYHCKWLGSWIFGIK